MYVRTLREGLTASVRRSRVKFINCLHWRGARKKKITRGRYQLSESPPAEFRPLWTRRPPLRSSPRRETPFSCHRRAHFPPALCLLSVAYCPLRSTLSVMWSGNLVWVVLIENVSCAFWKTLNESI